VDGEVSPLPSPEKHSSQTVPVPVSVSGLYLAPRRAGPQISLPAQQMCRAAYVQNRLMAQIASISETMLQRELT